MLEAEVYITLKESVSDPQGLTIKHALESLGYSEVRDVRIGKLIILKLDIGKDAAEKKLDEMCRKLLANPIIENYRIKIKEG